MSNINDLFVPYAESLDLKELGFDEPCLASIRKDKDFPYIPSKGGPFNNQSFENDFTVPCPTYQQAFKFFRDKYNLIGLVEGGYDNGKNIFTYIIWNDFKDDTFDSYCPTYEQAELECLRKLIEICKSTD